jgi:hypothetical protein
METALVLSADSWEMTDESTGEVRRGVSLCFVNQYRDATDKSVGLRPTKTSATAEVFEAIRKGGAPGLYQLDFRTRPGKEGKPVLTAARAEFVRKLDLFGESAVPPSERKSR